MEKRNPTFDLQSIREEFSTVDRLRMTRSARNTAFELGLDDKRVLEVLVGIERNHFVKSMTSIHDHRLWQDVYNVPFGEIFLYVKFSIDDDGHVVISFKEK